MARRDACEWYGVVHDLLFQPHISKDQAFNFYKLTSSSIQYAIATDRFTVTLASMDVFISYAVDD